MFQFLNLSRRKIDLYFSCSHIETRCLPLMHQIAIMLYCCWKFFKPIQNSVISPLTYTKHLTTSPSSVFLSSLCPSVYQLLFSFFFFSISPFRLLPKLPLHITLPRPPLQRKIACAGAAGRRQPSFIVVPVTSNETISGSTEPVADSWLLETCL